MTADWPVVSLGDISNRGQYGYTASASDFDTGRRFLRTTDIVKPDLDWGTVPFCEIDDEGFAKYKLEPGDLVISRMGSIGVSAFIQDPPNAVFASYLIRFRIEAGLADPRYVYYALQSAEFASFVKARGGSGSVQPNINARVLSEFRLRLPSIEEQRAIASVLGALDDKIELNRRMNKTLEARARAIFTSWFVDFDPVRARAEGRQPVGMDAETAALFPDSFEDSPLGPIPSGWYAGELGDVVAINTRSRLPGYPHHEIQYVDIASVSQGRVEITTPVAVGTAPSRARRLVSDGDVIWSCVRPNRRSYLRIDHPPENLVVSTGFAVLTPTIVPSSYLYLAVTTDYFVDYLTANADGSAYPAVRPEHFDRAPLLIPEKPVLNAFDEWVAPMLARVAANDRESNTLASTRDALLPNLVSGVTRLRPSDATEQTF